MGGGYDGVQRVMEPECTTITAVLPARRVAEQGRRGTSMSRSTKEQLELEKRQMHLWLVNKQRNQRAFVARACKGKGEDRSVVLIGNEKTGWAQAVKFWHGDHKIRAANFVAEYNAREKK